MFLFTRNAATIRAAETSVPRPTATRAGSTAPRGVEREPDERRPEADQHARWPAIRFRAGRRQDFDRRQPRGPTCGGLPAISRLPIQVVQPVPATRRGRQWSASRRHAWTAGRRRSPRTGQDRRRTDRPAGRSPGAKGRRSTDQEGRGQRDPRTRSRARREPGEHAAGNDPARVNRNMASR